MYCVNCGVKLSDTEKICPLCQTAVFHPDIRKTAGEDLYPREKYPARPGGSKLAQILLTAAFILPALIVLLCDFRFSPSITWSGYVIGALFLTYVIFVLPTWFRDPNPVIFVPCDFAGVALYLLYIDLMTDGNWFLTFAFPTVGFVCLLVTAVVTLIRYVQRGWLFIFGGAFVLLGLFTLLLEFLLVLTFPSLSLIGWSLYSAVTLVLLGGLLIFLGIYRPAREIMERKFFI